jgi:hypothetical protein
MSQSRATADLERANLDKLASALRVAKETEEIASVTSTTLHQQTEQLHRISHKQDQVHANIQKSSRVVTGMESIFGRVKNLFTKKPKDAKPVAEPESDPRRPDKPRSEAPGAAGPQGRGAVVEETKDRKRFVTAEYAAQEDQLIGEIDDSVNTLKAMARNMGDTLDHHNELLDGIAVKSDKNTADLAALQKRTTKLLR